MSQTSDIIAIDTSIKGFMLKGMDVRPQKIVAGGMNELLISTNHPCRVVKIALHPSGIGSFRAHVENQTATSFKLVVHNKGKTAKHFKALIHVVNIEEGK